jgi:hypothetical protein
MDFKTLASKMYPETLVLDVRQTSGSTDSHNNRTHHFDSPKYWLDRVFSAVLGHTNESFVNLSWSNINLIRSSTNLVIFTYFSQIYTNVDTSKCSVELKGKSFSKHTNVNLTHSSVEI